LLRPAATAHIGTIKVSREEHHRSTRMGISGANDTPLSSERHPTRTRLARTTLPSVLC